MGCPANIMPIVSGFIFQIIFHDSMIMGERIYKNLVESLGWLKFMIGWNSWLVESLGWLKFMICWLILSVWFSNFRYEEVTEFHNIHQPIGFFTAHCWVWKGDRCVYKGEVWRSSPTEAWQFGWFQPVWKICSSNWIISPSRIEKRNWNHHPVICIWVILCASLQWGKMWKEVLSIVNTSNGVWHDHPDLNQLKTIYLL